MTRAVWIVTPHFGGRPHLWRGRPFPCVTIRNVRFPA